MKFNCPQCQIAYELPDVDLSARPNAQLRCRKCLTLFAIADALAKSGKTAAGAAPATAATAAGAPAPVAPPTAAAPTAAPASPEVPALELGKFGNKSALEPKVAPLDASAVRIERGGSVVPRPVPRPGQLHAGASVSAAVATGASPPVPHGAQAVALPSVSRMPQVNAPVAATRPAVNPTSDAAPARADGGSRTAAVQAPSPPKVAPGASRLPGLGSGSMPRVGASSKAPVVNASAAPNGVAVSLQPGARTPVPSVAPPLLDPLEPPRPAAAPAVAPLAPPMTNGAKVQRPAVRTSMPVRLAPAVNPSANPAAPEASAANPAAPSVTSLEPVDRDVGSAPAAIAAPSELDARPAAPRPHRVAAPTLVGHPLPQALTPVPDAPPPPMSLASVSADTVSSDTASSKAEASETASSESLSAELGLVESVPPSSAGRAPGALQVTEAAPAPRSVRHAPPPLPANAFALRPDASPQSSGTSNAVLQALEAVAMGPIASVRPVSEPQPARQEAHLPPAAAEPNPEPLPTDAVPLTREAQPVREAHVAPARPSDVAARPVAAAAVSASSVYPPAAVPLSPVPSLAPDYDPSFRPPPRGRSMPLFAALLLCVLFGGGGFAAGRMLVPTQARAVVTTINTCPAPMVARDAPPPPPPAAVPEEPVASAKAAAPSVEEEVESASAIGEARPRRPAAGSAAQPGGGAAASPAADVPVAPEPANSGGLLAGLSAAEAPGPHSETPTEPVLPGGLPAREIQKTVAQNQAGVRQVCWQKAIAGSSVASARSARVEVTVQIAANGSVSSVTHGPDPSGYPGLANCITARIRSWKFARSTTPTTANIPFVFAAQQ